MSRQLTRAGRKETPCGYITNTYAVCPRITATIFASNFHRAALHPLVPALANTPDFLACMARHLSSAFQRSSQPGSCRLQAEGISRCPRQVARASMVALSRVAWMLVNFSWWLLQWQCEDGCTQTGMHIPAGVKKPDQ